MTVTSLIWKLRNSLSQEKRAVFRKSADWLLIPLGSISGGSPDHSYCSLTFDDGPDETWTRPLLQLLADHQMHATFFLLTKQARMFPDLVREIIDGGHEVALHGEDHVRLTTLSVREVSRRIRSAKAELEQLTRCPVALFRPPYGAQSIMTYLMARCTGMEVVVWGPYAEDWVDGSAKEVAERGLAGTGPGEIVLLHDRLELLDGEVPTTFNRLTMFENVIDGLNDRGLKSVTVTQLCRVNGARRTAWFRP